MKRSVSLSSVVMGSLVLAGAVGCGFEEGAADESEIEHEVKVLRAERPVPGQYIVAFRSSELSALGVSASAMAQQMVSAHGGKMVQSYDAGFVGFAAQLSPAALKAIAADPRVEYIEEDGYVSLAATQTPTPSWGLDRIDQRNRPLNNAFTYTNTGLGVHAYIIDTGVRRTHTEFTGRMGNGFDAVTAGGTANDCNGHGTHVAGTVAGTRFGVAKRATVHAVRVLDCNGSGTWSGVISGINWVTQNRIRPAVANMSLGGARNTSVDNAVAASIAAGVTYAVAAGNNSGANSCNFSPAATPTALTVGSSTSTDAVSSFSNQGSCVDLFAPGSSITSAWHTSDTATNTISGTSMASPHVAGAAAKYLQTNTGASAATVHSAIVSGATTGVLTGVVAPAPNRLLFTNN